MNKIFKNVLMIGLLIILVVISTYFISSCSTIFSSFRLDSISLINKVFATRDAENILLFTNENEVYYFDGKKEISLIYYINENYINMISESEEIHFEFFAVSSDELYNIDMNRNFYFVKELTNEN